MDMEIQLRCEHCFDWATRRTNEQYVERECGRQYMVSAMAVDVQK